MKKRIFVAIDGSATAQLALAEAIHFASLPGASLCIGTVLDKGNSKIIAITGSNGKTTTTALTYHICKEAGLDAHRMLVESGNKRIAELISDSAKQWDADLIVIGTHGRRGFERLLMGSVAENLVRIATTSLFLVRRQAEPQA